jgi:hypothetical protein
MFWGLYRVAQKPPDTRCFFGIKTLLHHTVYFERVWDSEEIYPLGIEATLYDRTYADVSAETVPLSPGWGLKDAIRSKFKWAILLCYAIPDGKTE